MRSHWSGRLAFILAASGSAIGLGNIWKFPYITGENGGGAFVLVYLLTIAIVGFPIFIAEVYIGQQAQTNAVRAFEILHKKKSPYRTVGVFGLLSAFLILSFYSVVGGWILSYEWQALTGGFQGLTSEQIAGSLDELLSQPGKIIFWHSIFMLLTVGIVIGGISSGIEKWSKILMPLFFLLLGALLIFSFSLEGFGEAFSFLFSPDFSELSAAGLLEAVGHSFFTLSLGMGAMITYGSYLSEKESVIKTALTITVLDTVIALIAGLVMFSITFTFGKEPGAGPGLMFSTMPTLFNEMAGSAILLATFFALVAFAAMTSAISLLQVVVAYFEENGHMSRRKATLVFGFIIWLMGILCGLSFNVFQGTFDFFELFDKATSSFLMPLGGMLTAIYFGWVIGEKPLERMLGGPSIFSKGLLWTMRIIAPTAVFVVMVQYLVNWLAP
ncbi:MAG: sodium-dependent transporter [Oligoflexus sp.]